MSCPYRASTNATDEEACSPRSRAVLSNASAYYGSYLHLDTLLSLNQPATTNILTGQVDAPDEHLFITVHQVHELWFKQMLFDLRRVLSAFSGPCLADEALNQCVSLLNRTSTTVNALIDGIEILATMTPMDFLEFRDFLVPASGFQSVQFRTLEILLGLPLDGRKYGSQEWLESRLNSADQQNLRASTTDTLSLLNSVDSWLCRTPFLQAGFDWQVEYRAAVHRMLASDEQVIQSAMSGNPDQLQSELHNLQMTRDMFDTLFDFDKYSELKNRGVRKLSQKAFINAIFVFLYKDKPLIQMPYLLLQSLLTLDERLFVWRSRHAELAQRMIGVKIGTGGTAGVDYLQRAASNNRVFSDLKNLSTFLIPKSAIPHLPADLELVLRFRGEF
jgi:tryptophan 2,3-dioxygenase